MARARNIKPSFFTNDVLAEVDPLGRLLFAGLWTISDRDGRLEDRPKRIKTMVLPYDDADVDLLLNELHARKFIVRYTVGGNRYIQITTFSKHQNPHSNERPSDIPSPDHDDSRQAATDEHSASTVQISGQHNTSTVQIQEQYSASTISETDEHSASTVQAPNNSEALGLNPYTESITPNTESITRAKTRGGARDPPPGVKPKVWAAWLKHCGKRLTAESVRLQHKHLSEWRAKGHDPNAIIETSIANRWKGLFEPKPVVGSRPRSPAQPAEQPEETYDVVSRF
jgi:hypothetical protein